MKYTRSGLVPSLAYFVLRHSQWAIIASIACCGIVVCGAVVVSLQAVVEEATVAAVVAD